MTKKFQTLKGFYDVLPEKQRLWRYFEEKVLYILDQYHYQEIGLPLVEPTGLFVESVGSHTDIVEKEIILEDIPVIKYKPPIIDNISKYETNYKGFELLYRFLMYIDNKNWHNIAINIIQNKLLYPNLYKVLSDHFLIINDNCYFDIFSSVIPLPIKDLSGKNIDINTFNYEHQIIDNTEMYGNIGVATKSKGVLSTKLVFKLISGNNKGTKCETQSVATLNDILNIKKNNKTDKCIKIAETFYNENKLMIIPYIKMK